METCDLRKRLHGTGYECDESQCVFWGALGPDGESEPRCAVKYFSLLSNRGREFAEWLLSLKQDQLIEVLGGHKIGPAPKPPVVPR